MKTVRKIDPRGTVTLPVEMRQGLEGELVEVVRRDDGVIELRPLALIDKSQTWFWSQRWQQREREADADIQAGRVERFDDASDLLAHLDALTDKSDPPAL